MMQPYVQFVLEPQPHPYPNEPNSRFEAWGQLSLIFRTDKVEILLLCTQWNFEEFAEWFAAYRNALCIEALSIAGEQPSATESVAQAVQRFRAREFTDDETEAEFFWSDAISAYRAKHSLRSAMPGARIPDIFIGCNHGIGEISHCAEDNLQNYPWHLGFHAELGDWTYRCDMTTLINELHKTLEQFLHSWLTAIRDTAVQQRARDLLDQLAAAKIDMGCC